MKVFTTAAMAILLFAAWSLGGDEKVVEVENAQREIGDLSAVEAEDLGILAEEYEINFPAAGGESAERSKELLLQVAREDVPGVLEKMRALLPAERAEGAVAAVTSRQDVILAKIGSLVEAGATGVSAELLARRAEAIIQEQQKLQAEARRIAAGTLGKRTDELRAGEKADLDTLEKNQGDLARQAAALEKQALDAAEGKTAQEDLRRRVGRALSESGLEKARTEMEEAAAAAGENKLARALVQQQQATERLEAFKEALKGAGDGKDAREALEELSRRQRDIAEKTREAEDPSDIEGLSERQENLAGKAEALAGKLSGSPLASEFLDGAAGKMNEARQALGKPEEDSGDDDAEGPSQKQKALEAQEQALDLLAGARRALDDPTLENLFAGIEESLEELSRAGGELEALEEIIEKQQELASRTGNAAEQPNQLAELAGEQEGLGAELESAFGEEDAPERPENGGRSAQMTPDAAEARDAMAEAAEALERGDAEEAGDEQAEATSVLEQARDKLAGEMMQAGEDLQRMLEASQQAGTPEALGEDLQELMDEAAEMAKSLDDAAKASGMAEQERQMARESASLPEEAGPGMQAAAGRQEVMAAEAQGMQQAGPEGSQFVMSMNAAAEEMSAAATHLRGGEARQATGRISKAAGLLESAARAAILEGGRRGSRQRPSRHTPSRRGEPQRGIGMVRAAGGGRVAGRPRGATWLAKLAERARPDIVQAAQGEFPRGYEEVLKRYYEELAKKDTEK